MKILTSDTFVADLKKLVRRNPLLATKVRKALKLLKADPTYPSLRLHKIEGETYSVSVDMKIRILLTFKEEGIVLLTIGSHDEVYN